MDELLAFLTADLLAKPLWLWFTFLALVGLLLAFDLGLLHRDDKELGIAESLKLSAFYIAVAFVFGGWVWRSMGPEPGMAYFTGYAIEKALSIDNVFVISLIFAFFAIPARYQYRALVWGILAVLVLRGLMIAVGAALVQEYDWVLLVFGAFLALTGIKMLFASEGEKDIAKNPVVRFLSRRMRVTQDLHGERFFVRLPDGAGRKVLWATPLFLALVVINLADLVFAVDSVPAIFAVTTDTYIVFTANIMAVLGLRALLRACRDGTPLRVPEVCAGAGPRLHRRQDFLEPLCRQARPGDLAFGHARHHRGRRVLLAMEDAWAGCGRA